MSGILPLWATVTYRWLALAVVLVTLALASACGGDSTGPSVSPSTTPGQSPTVNEYGPLAVVDASGGGPLVRGGAGPVRIEGDCVTVAVENGDVLLLIWQSANVRWDDENEAIVFTSLDQDTESVTIRGGDEIEVGGALLDNLPLETQLDWLATPHPNCSGEEWFVSGITRQ